MTLIDLVLICLAMTTLTIVSGGISAARSCGQEERAYQAHAQENAPLIETHEKKVEFSLEEAQKRCDELKLSAPSASLWKAKTFYTALSSPLVESISFIPSNIEKTQKLFATRGRRDGYIEPFSFWERKDVRVIDNFTGLEAEQLDTAKKIVKAFENDEMTWAIAVTFKHRHDENLDIYIWAKNPFFQK
ncbi:MAG: hypothetical protein JSR58_06260 [Verrucomicrobia bacterium]|nr:hypothetical protein [Verrucomicrobiota bacterium]